MSFCTNCGTQNPDDSKFCRECGKELIHPQIGTYYETKPSTTVTPINSADTHPSQDTRKQDDKKRKKLDVFFASMFIIIMCVLVWVVIGHFIGGNKDETIPTTKYTSPVAAYENSTEHEEPTEELTEATTSAKSFKNSCKTISYKDIARQPNKYYDEKVVYTGQVFQVSQKQDDGLYYALVYVTQNEYGYYDDTMYVCYELEENEPKFLEDDIVTFYGECKGEISYESVLGNEITIPAVYAKYIELVK